MIKEKRLEVRLSEDDHKKIEERMKQLNVTNKSEFVRYCALNTQIVDYNDKEILGNIRLIKSISDNINQIARRINSTSNIYEQDIKELKEDYQKLWLQQISILSNLQKLKP